MTDIVDPATRSRMMSGIRGGDTGIEMLVRRGLHARGYRYSLHRRDLPGKPDIVLPRFHAAIFVHGCFWHWHGCLLSKMPGTRRAFWHDKLMANRKRDETAVRELRAAGWRVAVVWECSLRGQSESVRAGVTERLAAWLAGDTPFLSIEGSSC